METKTKTIDGDQYEISLPYEAGHKITDIEARVLNQTRSENIGNNVRATLKKMKEEGASGKDLQKFVSNIDAEYEFTAANVRSAAKKDPVEKEAEKKARALVRDKLAETGRHLTKPPEGQSEEEWAEKVAAEVDRVAALPEVVAAAKQDVEARQKRAETMKGAIEGVNL